MRVIVRAPCAGAGATVKAPCLHCVELGHSFVDSNARSGRQQRAAHPHRADRPCFRLPARAARLGHQPVERDDNVVNAVAAGDANERAERAARRARRRAGRRRTTNNSQRTTNELMRGMPARSLVGCRVALLLARRCLGARAPRPAPTCATRSSQRPTLLLLTSLPLVFGEEFSLAGRRLAGADGARDALSRRADQRHRRRDAATGAAAADGASARAAGRESGRARRWVRGGGRVLLLADPMLEWPSERPLGDPLRPPPCSRTPGCSPIGGCGSTRRTERGPQRRALGGNGSRPPRPARLAGSCARSASDGFVARCRDRQGPGDDRRRRRLPQRRAASTGRPTAISTRCSPSLRSWNAESQ